MQIKGPSGTPYDGGIYSILVTFPVEFPLKPFNFKILTPLLHPNVISHPHHFSVCNCSLGYQLSQGWLPTVTIAQILTKLRTLL